MTLQRSSEPVRFPRLGLLGVGSGSTMDAPQVPPRTHFRNAVALVAAIAKQSAVVVKGRHRRIRAAVEHVIARLKDW